MFRFGDKSFMKSASKIGSLLESWFTANISVFSSSVFLVNIKEIAAAKPFQNHRRAMKKS